MGGLSTRRHNAGEIIGCFVGCYSSMDTKRENDVALMKSQEQRRRRITEKYSSKEIKEMSKFSKPNTCLILSYSS